MLNFLLNLFRWNKVTPEEEKFPFVSYDIGDMVLIVEKKTAQPIRMVDPNLNEEDTKKVLQLLTVLDDIVGKQPKTTVIQ